MAPHSGHRSRGNKQHALLRTDSDQPGTQGWRARPLWVYDTEDWALMRAQSTGMLICPEPGCRAPLTTVQRENGTRFLRSKPSNPCDHSFVRPDGGGGPMSAEHRWLQGRLARVCESLGYRAITEHAESNSDVYIPGAELAVEVQRWSTQFERRTAHRRRLGLKVVWMIPESAKGKGVGRALFRLPAVRLAVRHRDDRRQPLEPWKHPAQDKDAILVLYGTVARPDAQTGVLRIGMYDAAQFLAEVLRDQRQWYPPGTPGLPHRDRGAWARAADLERARTAAGTTAHAPQPQRPLPAGQTPGIPEVDRPPAELPKPVSTPMETVPTPAATEPTPPAVPLVVHRPAGDQAPPAQPSHEPNPADRPQPSPAPASGRLSWWRRLLHRWKGRAST